MLPCRTLAVLFGIVCLLLAQGTDSALARDVFPVPFDAANIDINSFAERVESSSSEADVETTPDATGAVSYIRLSARSQGPIYRWVVFSLSNTSPIPIDYVVVAEHRTFVGSGVIWPDFGTKILIDAQASPGLPPTPEELNTADGFSFRIPPSQTITYALEVTGEWPENMMLWQRDAFDAQRQQVSFFHGLLLGIAVLVAIYISSLFIIRRKLMFPLAALFSWAGVAFLAIEFGYLPILLDVSAEISVKVRSFVEACMAFSLLGCLYTFVELRKRMPPLGYFVLLMLFGCLALIGYVYQEPIVAAGIARMTILVSALLGLLIVLTLSRRGVIRAQVAISAWILVSVWTVAAALAATGILVNDLIGPGLAAGIVLVNLMLAFTVTQYAFDAGVISSRFFEDSGRRALALAGSEQSVWDWREDQGFLFVGQELEKVLSLRTGSLSGQGVKAWLEIMHPGDRPAYVAAVEAAIQRGRGTFSQEFRLRRKDGTYRWYQLRARAVPGEQGRASRCIGTLADITTFKRSEERLLYDAVQDRLTGLPNRALFMDRLERAMRRAREDDSMILHVCVVDIDRFKNVNDGLGHSIGDSLLLTVARRLENFIGPEDSLARLSGDQFGIIINAARPERNVRDLAESMRQAVAQPVQLKPREVFLTASLGVTEYAGDISSSVELLKDAEIALYEAKRRGKNKIEYFRPNMRDDRSKLIEIESDLRRALERNEIEVAYQPIHHLESGELAGFEALVRWRHPRHGLLGPDEFIGVAEETGLIVDLGHYVMGEAARQLGIWQRVLRPTHPIFVSVNLSGRQVLDQNLVDDVKTIMSREDVSAGSLKLELTESMIMENVELSVQVLEKLRETGVAILCDDFGTGYSSLSILQRLPFDTLKLDRSFVMTDPEDDTAAVILESMILMAHDLDMKVVAEGIENQEQLQRLKEFECDFGQGFLFGEALSARAVIEALGGKPNLLESKKPRSGRGLFGRLLRPSTRVEPEAPPKDEEEGSRLVSGTTEQRGSALDLDSEPDEFRREVEARRLERMRRPTINIEAEATDDSAVAEPAEEAERVPVEQPSVDVQVPEPAEEVVPGPVDQIESGPAEEDASELHDEVVPEPVVEAAPEPVVEAAPEPVVEAAPEPVEDVAPEPVEDVAPEPAVEAPPVAPSETAGDEDASGETREPASERDREMPATTDRKKDGDADAATLRVEPAETARALRSARETVEPETTEPDTVEPDTVEPDAVDPDKAVDDTVAAVSDPTEDEPPSFAGTAPSLHADDEDAEEVMELTNKTSEADGNDAPLDPERQLEELANQRRKSSRLGKLLRRGRKKQPVLEE